MNVRPFLKSALLLSALLLALIGAAPPRMPATLPSGAQESAAVLRVGSVDYLAAADVVRWLGATREWDAELEKLTLQIRGHVLRATVGTRWYQWDKMTLQGPDAPLYRSNALWLPASLLTQVVPVESGLRMHWDEASKRYMAGAAAAAAPGVAAAPGAATLVSAGLEEQGERSVLTLTFSSPVGLERESTQRSGFAVRFRAAPPAVDFKPPAGRARLVKTLDIAREGSDSRVRIVLPADAVGYVVGHLTGPERWTLAFSSSVDALESGKLTAFQMPGTRMPSRAARVVIDPGHGGADHGAEGAKLTESAVVLDIARALKAELEKDGQVTVVLTRDTDSDMPAGKRAEFANAQHAEMCLSIHADGAPSPKINGYRIAVWPASEDKAAGTGGSSASAGVHLVPWEDVASRHTHASETLAGDLDGSLTEIWSNGGRGIVKKKFLPLEGLDMPAVMIECGSLSSAGDQQRLSSDREITRIAGALAEGIRRHLAHAPRTESNP